MNITIRALRYILIIAVMALLLGLLWWYFFLHSQSQTITNNDSARGYTSDVMPSQNSIGDTYNNIVSGISDFINNTGTKDAGTAPQQLWHITKTPVAGMGFVGTKLRFAERSTGQIWEAEPQTGTVVRLTNKLFPKTYEAIFGRNGEVILRSLDEGGVITSFSGTVATSSNSSATTSPLEITGKYLDRGIREIVPIPETRELLYAVENLQGGVDVVRSMWDGSKKKSLFSSPLSSWRIGVLTDGRSFLAQNPADNVAGSAYELKNGALIPQVRDTPGLTFLPRTSSSAFLSGASQDGALLLYARIKEGATIETLPVRTVADKCVWAPPSAPGTSTKKPAADAGPFIAYCAVPQTIPSTHFFTDWYGGIAHTTDAWWRIDVSANTVELIPAGPSNDAFDVENPVIDTSGKNIAFMNSQDKTLWLLRMRVAANPISATSTSQ